MKNKKTIRKNTLEHLVKENLCLREMLYELDVSFEEIQKELLKYRRSTR